MTPILIVGAGPTGLAAAIELRRFGLPVRLIDKADHAARWSQALIVQARTLEQFERYGLAGEAVARGRVVSAVHFHNGDASLAHINIGAHIPGRFPFLLCLPQNDTEDILTRHLRTLGTEVERGVELTGFSNTAAGDGATAHLRHTDGREERSQYRFLLGCDGAHSLVRRDTLTPFTGDTVPEHLALGDLELTGPDVPPSDELALYFHRGGWAMLILHLPNGQHRVITVWPRDSARTENGDAQDAPTLADFNADFERFGLKITASVAGWLSPFRVNERKAEQYRHGNVFLLGDAAHIHSPVGGQGMNTGIQDAANLAWKLHAVLSGAPGSLLDSYDAERGPVARNVLRGSALGLCFAGSQSALVEHVRNFVIHHAFGLQAVDDVLGRGISQTAISYRGSPAIHDDGPSGPLRAGDRMPDTDLDGSATLLAPLHTARHLLLAIDVPGADVPRDLKNTAVTELHIAGSPRHRELTEALGPGPLLYLIRPDGYIGFRGQGDGEALRGYARAAGLAT